MNSRPLTTETLRDATRVIPLSPSNLLTVKSKFVMPPPGVFQRLDLYFRRRRRRVQHLDNEFWSRWREEYLTTYKLDQTISRSNEIYKWRYRTTKGTRSFPQRLANGTSSDVRWDDKKEWVRSVTVLMANSDPLENKDFLDHSITKLVLLVEAELVDKDWQSEVYKCLQSRFVGY